MIPNAGFIPSGFITPASFCVTGSGFYTITLIYYFNNGGLSDTCLFKYSFDCPQPPSNCNCDSLKNTLLQTSAIPGTCCYKMQGNIPSANCFTEIQVVLSACLLYTSDAADERSSVDLGGRRFIKKKKKNKKK